MSQFLINENMKMPAEAVAITGGSILGLLLGGTAECRCTSRLIGSFRPSVRRNAKPRWSWSPVRRESCRRVGPAGAKAAGVSAQPPPSAAPSSALLTIRGIFGPVILHFRILRNRLRLGVAWWTPSGEPRWPPHEFTFRFNARRCKEPGKLFERLMQQALTTAPVSYGRVVARSRSRR